MPRIFKGSESTLRLLISKTGDYQALTEIKIKLYTTDIENAIEVIDGIEVDDNIATINLAPRAFMGMEDGLINYIIDGATEDDVFHTERQSNYMLKTLSYINEDGVATQTMTIDSNGEYRITPNDGLYVDINVNVEDVNGSYDEGFNVGYEQGKTDGVSEQKSKLETISITENGVYSNEDGYNHIEVNVPDLNGSYEEGYNQGYAEGEQVSYNTGYEQGQKDIAENARVLEVTENGFYDSKFSEIPKPDVVTGVYPDGTEFYNFAELTNIVYNTGIKLSENTKVEIWYKPRDLGFLHYGGIIGTIEDNSDNAFSLFTRVDNGFNVRIKFLEYFYRPNDLNKWFHIELSFAEGFVIDGVTYATYDYNTGNLGRYLFINKYDRCGDGYYGMIKIDDTIIIPTEEGFLNTNTGTLLEVVEEGLYSFTNNTPKVPEGELYKTVNVNIAPKINVQKAGTKLGNSLFTEVPDWVDFDGITDLSNMFDSCSNLKSIEWFNTEFVTKANSVFSNCGQLKTLPNNFNFGICTDMNNFFANSNSLNDFSFLETWVFNPTTSMDNMITNTNTTYVPAIPCVGNAGYYESSIFFSYSEYSQLTYFGGWIGRKYNVIRDQSIKRLPNLTRESCISILNNLYDFTGNGETPGSNQGTLKVHQNFLDTVGEDISIGINKGWTITA